MKIPMERSGSALWALSAMLAVALAATMLGMLSPYDTVRDGFFSRSFGGGARHLIEPVRSVP
jgi:hypothetical protein